MIREATIDDIPEIVEMLARLQRASGALGKFDKKSARAAVIQQIEDKDRVLFRSEKGLIAGGTMIPWDSPDWLIVFEMWWWAEDGQWVPLARRLEQWARQQGAGEIRMASTLGPKSGRFAKVFLRAGYEPREICYRKEIKWVG